MSTIGTIELLATIDTSQYLKGASQIDKANSQMEDSTDKSSGKMSKSFNAVATVGLAAIAAAAVAVTAIVVKNFDNAIKRVDTLNNSARTFANIGFGADEVKSAMHDLDMSIRGLPTPLDEAVRGVTKIAASTNNLGKSRKTFSALNNAIIGFGGTTDDVSTAVTQLSQELGTGRITAQTWLSLTNAGLTPALAAMARQMGITTKALKEGLSDGTISTETFQDALITLNEKGGGGMKSFEKIAKDATAGIGTGWQNLQTAITRGIASIITAVGSEKISKALSSIGKAFEGAFKSVASALKSFSENEAAVEIAIYTLAGVITGTLVAALYLVAPIIAGIVTAFAPFIAAGAAVGLVALLIKNNWDKIAPVIDTVKNAFLQFWQVVKPFRDAIGEQFTNAWKDLKKAFEDIQKAIAPFLPQIKTLGKFIGIYLLVSLGVVVGIIGAFIASIIVAAVVVARLIGWIAKATIWFINFNKEMFATGKTIVKSFITATKQIYTTIVNTFNSIVSFIREWGITIIALLLLPFSIAVGWALEFKTQVVDIFKSIWSSLVSIMTPVISFFSNLFRAAWNAVVIVWGAVASWFSDRWENIKSIFGSVADFFGNVFTIAFDRIKSIWNGLYGFFRGIWDRIVGLFSGVGSSVGDAIGGSFKSVINSVVRSAIGLINGFIRGINGVIGKVNNIPGVKVPNIGELGVPQLAQGGIVSSPTLAMIGEGREAEAVIPLSKLDKMINGDGGNNSKVEITVNLTGVMASSKSDLRTVAKQLVGSINDELGAKQQPLIGGGNI